MNKYIAGMIAGVICYIIGYAIISLPLMLIGVALIGGCGIAGKIIT